MATKSLPSREICQEFASEWLFGAESLQKRLFRAPELGLTSGVMKKLLLIVSLVGLTFGTALSQEAAPAPLVANGDFEAGNAQPWKIFAIKKVPATKYSVKEGKLVIVASEKGDKEFKRQMTQEVALKSNQKYLLEFKLKPTLDAPGKMRILLGRSKDPSKPHYGLWKDIELATSADAVSHQVHFTTKDIDPADPASLRFQLGTLQGTLEFDDITLTAK